MTEENVQVAEKQAETPAPAPAAEPTAEPAPAAPVNILAEPKAPEPETVPTEYKLTLPKDAVLKQEDLAGVAAFAKANKLTQSQAEAYLVQQDSAVKAVFASQKAQAEKISQEWAKESMADPEIGGEKLKAVAESGRRVLARFDTDGEVSKFLTETGYGNNKAVLKFFANLSKTMSEDQLVTGTTTQPAREKTRAEAFYGEQAK